MSSAAPNVLYHGSSPAPSFLSAINLVTTALQAEAHALQALIENIPLATQTLVNLLIATTGSIVFTGAGKSGLVGRKLSATFASLGLPSFFLHPHDALHGDIGMVKQHDLVIALSKSGTGSELELILLLLKQRTICTAAISCSPGPLKELATLFIQLPLAREACMLNLAPTSSSTIMSAYGDALAITASHYKGFTAHDFARNHPAGALGNTLLLDVAALMHSGGKLPLISPTASFETLLAIMMEKKLGIGIVVSENNALLGIITDGDLRRACAQGPAIFNAQAHEIMTLNPKTVISSAQASHALALMEDHSITTLVVINTLQHVAGTVHIHDLVKAGIRRTL